MVTMDGTKNFLTGILLVFSFASVITSKETPDPSILVTDWTEPGRILIVDMKLMNVTSLPLEGLDRPVAIDYDPEDGSVYWTDVRSHTINKCDLSGGRPQELVKLNSSSVPDGLAVDLGARKVFFTDTGNDVIGQCEMGRWEVNFIVKDELEEPRAITLDTDKELIYWTDWGMYPKIEMAAYDGSSRSTLVSTGLSWPNGITLDTQNDRLFWCDAKSHVIETVRLDGSGRTVLLFQPGAHYFDIFYYHDSLYFTDWNRNAILHIPASGGNLTTWSSPVFYKLAGIHVFAQIGHLHTGKYNEVTHSSRTSELAVTEEPSSTYRTRRPSDQTSAAHRTPRPSDRTSSSKTTPRPSDETFSSHQTALSPWNTSLRDHTGNRNSTGTSDDLTTRTTTGKPAGRIRVGQSVDITYNGTAAVATLTAIILGCVLLIIIVAIVTVGAGRLIRSRQKKANLYANLQRDLVFENNVYSTIEMLDNNSNDILPTTDTKEESEDTEGTENYYEEVKANWFSEK